MKNVYKTFWTMVLVAVSLFAFSGCQNTVVIHDNNDTNNTEFIYIKVPVEVNVTEPEKWPEIDPENLRRLVNENSNAAKKYSSLKIWEVDDYNSIMESLNDWAKNLIISNPKIIYILLDYFGDEYLAKQNKRTLVSLKALSEKATKAYEVVNKAGFEEEMQKFLEIERELYDGNKSVSWDDRMDQAGVISNGFQGEDEAKAYYRRFSTAYNPANKVWKKIIQLFDKQVKKALLVVEETPDLVVTIEDTDKGYYVTDKEGVQEIAQIKVDTSYSSEGVYIDEISANVYSWKGTAEFERCRFKNKEMNYFGYWFDFEDLRDGVGLPNQGPHQTKIYTLECRIDDGVVDGRNGIAIYNGSVEYEFDGGAGGYMGVYKSTYIRGITEDDEFVILKAKAFKKQLEEVADSKEKKEVLKLLNYFINDSYGGYGDGWLILKDELYNEFEAGSIEKVLDMDLLDWVRYFEEYQH